MCGYSCSLCPAAERESFSFSWESLFLTLVEMTLLSPPCSCIIRQLRLCDCIATLRFILCLFWGWGAQNGDWSFSTSNKRIEVGKLWGYFGTTLVFAWEDHPVLCVILKFSRLRQRKLSKYNEEKLSEMHHVFSVIKERGQGGLECVLWNCITLVKSVCI